MAIIAENEKTLIEFKPEEFKHLLKEYLDKEGSLDKAFDKLEAELKQRTKYL
jgi:hypothetical protein